MLGHYVPPFQRAWSVVLWCPAQVKKTVGINRNIRLRHLELGHCIYPTCKHFVSFLSSVIAALPSKDVAGRFVPPAPTAGSGPVEKPGAIANTNTNTVEWISAANSATTSFSAGCDQTDGARKQTPASVIARQGCSRAPCVGSFSVSFVCVLASKECGANERGSLCQPSSLALCEPVRVGTSLGHHLRF